MKETTKKFLQENQRSVIWLSEQTGIHYQRLYRFIRGMQELNEEDQELLILFLEVNKWEQ